jgi:epoxyqueuosine reductase
MSTPGKGLIFPSEDLMADAPWTTEDIILLCRDQGFARSGIAPATATARREELDAWIQAGHQGSMGWMERNLEVRADPGRLLEGAKSIICVADRYADGTPDHIEPGQGRIARYARGRDYHTVMKSRLHALCDQLRERAPEHSFRACVDTAPLLEREVAARAGLGSIGKHTLLIEPGQGSWLLLGEIVTTLVLDPTGPEPGNEHDPCGTCTRCIDACPTDAISPWSLDARRCISALTIEHREAIDPRWYESMDDWIFGCDICQEVCPHNEPTTRSQDAPMQSSYLDAAAPGAGGRSDDGSAFDLLAVLQWDESTRREAFRGSAMKRAKFDMMLRNAVIAAGNSLLQHDDAALRESIYRLTGAEIPDMVRNTALDVLSRVDGKPDST